MKLFNGKLLGLLLAAAVCATGAQRVNAQGPNSQGSSGQVLPTAEQQVWADAGIGVLIHYDITLFATKPFDYQKKETLPDLKNFNPARLNTDQWIKAAKDGGAKYAVLVVKHGTGFTLWPSKVNPYHVGNTPWRNGKGDILADFIRSCHKYGIAPGLYYNTNYNTYYGAGYTPFKDTASQHRYNRAVLAQLTELWTRYGKLFEIWFDGGVMADDKGGIASPIAELIRKNQPQAILFQGPVGNRNLVRWVGNEKGRAPYPCWSTADATTSATGAFEIKDLNGKPDGKIWCPGEADFPLRRDSGSRGGFMWTKNGEDMLLSVDELVQSYCTSVGRNANMLLGMVIDTAGLCPEPDVKRLQEFGAKIKKVFSNPLAQTGGKGNSFTLDLKTPQLVNCVALMEDIAAGERVRRYDVEAWVEGNWKKVCDGISIGHERIQPFDAVTTTKLRVTITDSEGVPAMKSFAVFHLE
ncbi:MAG TPA: alpha-L-fucosidase [Puia sp.]|jgi:alpha-L-fucosidase